MLGVLGALWPIPTLILLVAVAAIVLAIAAPRATAGITALVVLFVRPIEHLVPVPQVGYLDEALVVLCLITMPLRRVVARQSLRTFPGQWWFAGFIVCGLLSALLLHVPVAIFLTGAFVISKGLLFGWAVAQIDWAEEHLVRAARIGARPDRDQPRRRGGEPRDADRVERDPLQRHQRDRGALLPPVPDRAVHPSDRLRPVHGAVVHRPDHVAGGRAEDTVHPRAALGRRLSECSAAPAGPRQAASWRPGCGYRRSCSRRRC